MEYDSLFKVFYGCACVQSTQYKTLERVIQTVKNLCSALDAVETQPITEAVKRLRHQANLPQARSPDVSPQTVMPLPKGHAPPPTALLKGLN